MEETLRVETMEVDAGRWIALEMVRRWPKYVVMWSVRHQVGESDFPLAGGEVERIPRQGEDVDAVWDDLREQALEEARASIPAESPRAERKSMLDRLLGR